MKTGYARVSTAAQDSSIHVAFLPKKGSAITPLQGSRMRSTPSGDDDVSARPNSSLSRPAQTPKEAVKKLVRQGGAVSIRWKIYDPTDSMGDMFFGILRLMTELKST
ncbi:hypothetical protein [Rhodococcus sp. 24CO]|uniref:hypothetical protein n=1 Tax=Rhodococcus sp. 24CO TaxID=3117460 RepID=UPI003D32741B